MILQPWLVWQSGLGWIMQTLWVTLKLILGQTMLEGEAIAAFRASLYHVEIFPALAGLAIWPRLDNGTLWVTLKFNFGPDDA